MADATLEHHGGCLCGAVRYKFRGPPAYTAHCHCRSCQKALGAGFATWTGFKQDVFEVTQGEITYCTTSPGVVRGFCGKCGTSLTYAGEDWDTTGVTTATLDDPDFAMPTSNVYLEHQRAWVVLDDNLKTFKHFPD